jgi:methylthioribose-1-phosphate isomerase
MLDQRLLPLKEKYLYLQTVEETAKAIETLAVRGAPAIGVTAAYGMALAAQASAGKEEFYNKIMPLALKRLSRTRPTAVNLFWALERMKNMALSLKNSKWERIKIEMLEEAKAIEAQDAEMCKKMSEHGADLIPKQATILTHCNAGGLATAAYGTALGVIRAAHYQGKKIKVFADETRPVLQGARLTAWELQKDGIDVTLICDNSAGFLMQRGEIDLAIVGADRIVANGDFANKIGTYTVATLCRAHGIPFYVAAPTSTVDLAKKSGTEIPIEERSAKEVTEIGKTKIAPPGLKVRNYAFDVTPACLVTAIITEQGVIRRPFKKGLEKACKSSA